VRCETLSRHKFTFTTSSASSASTCGPSTGSVQPEGPVPHHSSSKSPADGGAPDA
jgi:hypothetical protein